MAKNTKTTAADNKTVEVAPRNDAPVGTGMGLGVQSDDAAAPKFGKVEARLAALESYVKANAKTLGWPEFKG